MPEQESVEILKREGGDLGEEDTQQRKKTMIEVDRMIAQVEKEAANRINLALSGSASASAPAAPATN